MSKVTFDGDNKLIYVVSESVSIQVKSELYSEWKRWLLTGSNAKYLETIRVVGGDQIDETTDLGDTYFLRNGWRIRPYDGNYILEIIGNLYTDEGSGSYVPATGSANITLLSKISNLIQTITSEGTSINSITSSINNIEKQTTDISQSLESLTSDVTIISSSIDNNTEILTELSASISEHRNATENLIKYTLGLTQHNFRMKDQIYDVDNNMLTATIRLYDNSSDAENDINHFKQYAVSSSYTGDLLTSYVVKEI